MLGVCERTFRRYVDRYEEEGLDGLVDKRLGQVSARRASVDEVVRTEALYRERYEGWNVKRFHSFYRREHGGRRSYTWVKRTLQRAGLVVKAPGRGKHRRRPGASAACGDDAAPEPALAKAGDGSTHEWVAGRHWDLIITLDDATSEHYSMFFVEEEGTVSSFRGMGEVIEGWGLASTVHRPGLALLVHARGGGQEPAPAKAGVDRVRLAQFGRAMRQLGVERMPACSPEARGRCERMFATHQSLPPRKRGSGCPRSLRRGASTRWTVRTGIWPSATVRRSTRSSRSRRRSPARPSCPSSVRSWPTSCASTMSARSVGTTV